MAKLKIVAVPPHLLPGIWPYVLRYVQEALDYEHGDLTPEKMYDRIIDMQYLCIVALRGEEIMACQTAEIYDTDANRVMGLITTGGKELDQWQDALAEALEQLAIEQGCDVIRTRGRLGWLRKLKRNGFDPLYFIAEKKLHPERTAA